MYLLFDIGATKMRVAVSVDGETFGEPAIEETPQDFEEGVLRITALALERSGGQKIAAACGGIAGPFDRTKSVLVNAPHLPKWKGKPLRAALEAKLGTPVTLENDTALVGLGEATAGAGKGQRIVAYITVSTGVNGVRTVGGNIDESALGFEIGHQIIDAGGALANAFHGEGRLEDFVSGSSFLRRFGKHPRDITDEAMWEETARLLAIGVHNTILHWSPDIVVIGGSMMKTPGISLARVDEHLKKILTIFPERPPLVPASLGDFGGLHGALALLQKQHRSARQKESI
ncbi:MAG: glucokinase [Parcubacteria group bacterium Gr01-1014_72]|nr:MAG: glucokinase [Parcubacteria group bacterium Gr01-1014_72]